MLVIHVSLNIWTFNLETKMYEMTFTSVHQENKYGVNYEEEILLKQKKIINT